MKNLTAKQRWGHLMEAAYIQENVSKTQVNYNNKS